jgi:hypothetical protein
MFVPRYKTIGMAINGGLGKDTNDYRMGRYGEDKDNMTNLYLLENQRAPYLVTVDPATRLLHRNGVVLDTTHAHNEYFIFVMDGDGRIFSEDKFVINHHSAFLAGNPVSSAGGWRVANGQVTNINNSSGHYMPPWDYTEQVLKELKRHRHVINGIQKNYSGATSKAIKRHWKKVNHTLPRMGPKGKIDSYF